MSLSIKEISQYAYEYALDRYEFRIQSEGQGNVLFYEIYDDKFAELIVRECIDWCNANARDDGTAQRIAEDIKKDFGVKE